MASTADTVLQLKLPGPSNRGSVHHKLRSTMFSVWSPNSSHPISTNHPGSDLDLCVCRVKHLSLHDQQHPLNFLQRYCTSSGTVALEESYAYAPETLVLLALFIYTFTLATIQPSTFWAVSSVERNLVPVWWLEFSMHHLFYGYSPRRIWMSDMETARNPKESAELDREFAEELWERFLRLGVMMGGAFVATVLLFMAGL